MKISIFPKSRAGEYARKIPLLRNRGTERSLHENRAYQTEKTTDIWLSFRLTAPYSEERRGAASRYARTQKTLENEGAH